jgi:hypothetical protein
MPSDAMAFSFGVTGRKAGLLRNIVSGFVISVES